MVSEHNGEWFRSDHMFDGFISPVTNPFLFEDPRSLTGIRPIFIYQQIPASQRDFLGGHGAFFGTQARVAFTDRWSLVLNKLGGVSANPGDGSIFPDKTGFAELWLGRSGFYRGGETGSVAASFTVQIPTGCGPPGHGTLSLVPYRATGRTSSDCSWGGFNVMASTGYAFSTNNQRSDYCLVVGAWTSTRATCTSSAR